MMGDEFKTWLDGPVKKIDVKLESVEKEEHHIRGRVDERFKPLFDVFCRNFDKGWEAAGASFAVFKDGELCVDLYGGYADVENKVLWTEHTTSVLFSTTKSISSVVLAYVMNGNGLTYDEKIINFWPEYGANGKSEHTLKDVVTHQAGLPYTEVITKREDILNVDRMAKYFETATPIKEAGPVYHALTFGLLLDQIVRRIDAKGRGLVQVFEENIVKKFGIEDLSIGLKRPEDNATVAVLTELSDDEVMRQGKTNKEAMRRFTAGSNEHTHNVYLSFPWITTNDYNVLENRLVPMPSNMGIGNARSLAHFHSLLNDDSLLPKEFRQNFAAPQVPDAFDYGIGYEEDKGCGFQFTPNPYYDCIFGHSGFGGQNVRVDMRNGVSFAYVSNGLKLADADLVEPWMALVNELYDVMRTMWKY
ncbi:unnamed protein product [Caenorhabditis auriculariae]|uniref:Beta-lactamase-related domain-containing protein n=1 Tax=Caenorhabditis auriculariae TaxID=2777116 RepID=A0A8S1H1G5_9PELO|nr:unnamed protein product [Caenorhabditis auriculariae]